MTYIIIHGHNPWKGKPTPTYNSWRAMKERCSNPNNKFYYCYGGKGIFVCRRWNTFQNFLKDMGERPEGKTLDRKDNNGPYAPWNCKWSDKYEQARNHSNKKLNKENVIEIKRLLKETKLYLREIAKKFGVSLHTIAAIKHNRIWRDV